MAQEHVQSRAREVPQRVVQLHRPAVRQIRESLSNVRQVLREQAQVGVHRERARHLLRRDATQAQPEAQHPRPAHQAGAAHHEVSAHAQGDQEVHGEGGQGLQDDQSSHRDHGHRAQERRRHDERRPLAGLRGPHHRPGPPPPPGHAARARARRRLGRSRWRPWRWRRSWQWQRQRHRQVQRQEGQASEAQRATRLPLPADHTLQRDDRLQQEVHQSALRLQERDEGEQAAVAEGRRPTLVHARRQDAREQPATHLSVRGRGQVQQLDRALAGLARHAESLLARPPASAARHAAEQWRCGLLLLLLLGAQVAQGQRVQVVLGGAHLVLLACHFVVGGGS